MQPSIGIIGAGIMGAGMGTRLHERGLHVTTVLEGRGKASHERAAAAGMVAVSPEKLVEADIILSVIPPGEAMPVAQFYAPLIARAAKKPIYAELNPVSPASKEAIGKVIGDAGAPFVDGGIIGGPPKPDGSSPSIYVSGPDAKRLEVLKEYGLNFCRIDGPVGAASALKMCQGAIQKAVVAIGVANILLAERAGVADELRADLAESLPDIMPRFRRALPPSYSRAYRWVHEMDEVASFIGPDGIGADIFTAVADVFRAMAKDYDGDRSMSAALDRFLKGSS